MGFVFGVFGSASAARQKAKMYEALEQKLGEKLDEVTQYYSNAETAMDDIHDSLANGSGEAEGNIMTDFTDKEGVWNREYKQILMAMQSAATTLSLRKSEAGQLKTFWEMLAEREEMENGGL
ncbi:MAG: hypothetical protein NC314_04335 [Roseburia sp.]|nr:hypothetical protein [Ruminococcus sp.]MCM1155913.1 hypothetical protein [Roseburia sp.]MCM1242047.1 hypothetical protein [Roseburia sp.]